jgi:hypothetical protein
VTLRVSSLLVLDRQIPTLDQLITAQFEVVADLAIRSERVWSFLLFEVSL